MTPGSLGDSDRSTRVPLVLAATVRVDLALAAYDRHGLRPGRTHLDKLGIERFRNMQCCRWWATATHDHPRGWMWFGRETNRVGGAEGHAEARKGDRPNDRNLVDDKGNVDSPVASWDFSELASSVERIDDPHALGIEARHIVLSLLTQDCIIGACCLEAFDQELVGLAVALVFEE